MKKMKNLLYITLLSVLAIFNSCEEEGTKEAFLTGTYIVNYGNYTGSKTTISSYDEVKDSIYHHVYKNVNEVEISSNVQYAAEYNGKIYMMSNDGDKIDIVDAHTFEATVNPISKDIQKPRYIVFNQGKGYVSCWGEGTDWSDMKTSYIAKVDLKNLEVEKKIPIPGGTEGLAIANGKLFAALGFMDSIAVMDLETEQVEFILAPAVSSYFLKDAQENLYVTLTSTWNDFSLETGLGYVNTQTNTLDTIYKLDGVSGDYGSLVHFNNEHTKIYVVAATWFEETKDNWVQKGAVQVFDLVNKTFAPFLENLNGISAVSVNPLNDKVYCLYTDGPTLQGTMEVYDTEGNKLARHSTGLSPNRVLFID
jgi:hypothetical protein